MLANEYGVLEMLGAFLKVIDEVDDQVSCSLDDDLVTAWEKLLPMILEKWALANFCSGPLEQKDSSDFAIHIMDKCDWPVCPREFRANLCEIWLNRYGLKGTDFDDRFIDCPFLMPPLTGDKILKS